MLLNFIHITANICSLLLCTHEQNFILWIYYSLFIPLQVSKYFSCFCFLAFRNNVNMHFAWTCFHFSFGAHLEVKLLGFICVEHLGNCQTVYQNGYDILCFQQQCMSVSFFYPSHSNECEWYLIVVVVCISLRTLILCIILYAYEPFLNTFQKAYGFLFF